MDKLLVILGPTATGKTDLALSLAKILNGELVSCDSRQVYAGLDIGSGKQPSGRWKKGKGFWEIDEVKIWMYDVVDPKNQYTVADYVRDAGRVIREIRERGKLPIIVGGTGLYLKALLEGLPNLAIPVDQKLRRNLERLSLNELQTRFQKVSPHGWNRMNSSDRQNPRRLVRAIELSLSSLRAQRSNPGRMNSRSRLPRHFVPRNDILQIGLTASRGALYQKVDERVGNRIDQGMIGEAKKLHKAGLTIKRMKALGLEYGVLADFLSRKIKTRKELVEIMQGKIHGFVRKQLTWFKKEKRIVWFDIIDKDFPAKVEKMVAKWYYPF